MSTLQATLYFTFQEGCDVGSCVTVDVATGTFNGDQAYRDMKNMTEDDPCGPQGYYLQVGKESFEVKHEIGNEIGNWQFRVIDLDGFQRAAEADPDYRPGRRSPGPS